MTQVEAPASGVAGTATPNDRRRRGRLGPVGVGQLVVLELAAVAAGVAVGRPLALAVAVWTIATLAVVATFLRRGGRWWYEDLRLRRRLRRRQATAPGQHGQVDANPLLMAGRSVTEVVDRGVRFGLGQDAGGWFAAFAVAADSGERHDRVATPTVDRAVAALAAFTGPVTALQLVVHAGPPSPGAAGPAPGVPFPGGQAGYAVPGQPGWGSPGQAGYAVPGQPGWGPSGQAGYAVGGQAGWGPSGQPGYAVPAGVGGALPPPVDPDRPREIWLAARLTVDDARNEAITRGGDIRGVHRTMAAAVRRLGKALQAADLAHRLLDRDELLVAVAAVAGWDTGSEPPVEHWAGVRSGGRTHRCFQCDLPPGASLGSLADALDRTVAADYSLSALVPSGPGQTSTQVLLRIAATDEVITTACQQAVAAIRRYATAPRRLDGQHAPASYAVAPTAATDERWSGVPVRG